MKDQLIKRKKKKQENVGRKNIGFGIDTRKKKRKDKKNNIVIKRIIGK